MRKAAPSKPRKLKPPAKRLVHPSSTSAKEQRPAAPKAAPRRGGNRQPGSTSEFEELEAEAEAAAAEAELRKIESEQAAAKLQAVRRGQNGRRKSMAIRLEVKAEAEARRERAVVRLQAARRGKSGRRKSAIVREQSRGQLGVDRQETGGHDSLLASADWHVHLSLRGRDAQ